MQWLRNIFKRSGGVSEKDFAEGNFDYDDGADVGVNVTPTGWLEIEAVWQAVDIISGDLAKYPLVPMLGEPNEPETWEPQREHPLYEVLAVEPRRGIDRIKFWRRFWVAALLWNNSYILVQRTRGGMPVALNELDPAYVTQNLDGTYNYGSSAASASNICHVEGLALPMAPSQGVFQRLDKFRTLSNCVKLTQLCEQYMRVWFERGGHNAGVLEVPPSQRDETRRKLEKQFSAARKHWFKTVVLRDGKWHSTGGSFRDQQIIELRNQQVASVARAFNLAPSRLGLPDNVSYSSQVEEAKEYAEQTLEPWERSIISETELKLLSEEERAAGLFLRYDKPKLAAEDTEDTDTDDSGNETEETAEDEQPRPATTSSETVPSDDN